MLPPYDSNCRSSLFQAMDVNNNQWRIQGAPLARAPLQVQILSFWHTNFSKRSRLGSWHPPTRLAPPYGKSLDPLLIILYGLDNFAQLITNIWKVKGCPILPILNLSSAVLEHTAGHRNWYNCFKRIYVISWNIDPYTFSSVFWVKFFPTNRRFHNCQPIH